MIAIFLKWIQLLGIGQQRIRIDLYVHENRKNEMEEFRVWWAEALSIDTARIQKTYLKKGNPKTVRKNTGDLYHGLLRITVMSSTILNRQVDGWIQGIVASVGSGVIGNTSAFGAEDSRIVP